MCVLCYRDNSQKARAIQGRLEMFVEQLSCMLEVSPSEDLIKDRIRQLQGLTKDGRTVRAHSGLITVLTRIHYLVLRMTKPRNCSYTQI